MPPKMRAPLERMPEGGGRRGDTCAHTRERLSATLVPPANALRGAAHRDKNTPCRRLFLLRNLSAVYERLQQVIVVNSPSQSLHAATDRTAPISSGGTSARFVEGMRPQSRRRWYPGMPHAEPSERVALFERETLWRYRAFHFWRSHAARGREGASRTRRLSHRRARQARSTSCVTEARPSSG